MVSSEGSWIRRPGFESCYTNFFHENQPIKNCVSLLEKGIKLVEKLNFAMLPGKADLNKQSGWKTFGQSTQILK